jgi:hypothetical protein
MPQETKKSYNPFKMWGSWVGLGIGIVASILLAVPAQPIIGGLTEFAIVANPFYYLPSSVFGNESEGLFVIYTVVIVTSPIFFFLYGWGIHSLFRKFSK